MDAIQLFLNINKPGLNNEWNSKITSSLEKLPAIEQVQVIEENEQSTAQISISYRVDKLSITDIEEIVTDSGAYLTDINIHFPSSITGITDPYGAAAQSIPIDEMLKNIEGVLSGAISSSGKIKVLLDTITKNKQTVIDEILKAISSLRFDNN